MRSLGRTGIIIFLIALTQLLYSQENGYFEGTVKDDETGETLIGANIVWKQDPSFGVATDVNGYFSLILKPGSYIFQLSYTGMVTDTVHIQIISGETVTRELSLKPYINQLQGIEVRAGRFDQRIEDITVSMEIIKPDLIENKNTTAVQNILDYTPGVNILDNEPQIRGGSGFTFGVGSKVAIIVDDMPMLSGDAGRPYWDFIPVENIEQIDVIKGASSVLSGSSALSGAIHIRTAAPRLTPETKVTIYTGIYSVPKDKSMKWWNGYPYIFGANFLHTQKVKSLDLTFGGTLNFDHGAYGAPKPGPYVVDTISNFGDREMASQKARINFNVRKRSEKIQGLNFGVNGNVMYHKSPMVLAWLDDTSGFYRAYPGAVFIQEQFIFHVDPYLNFYSNVGYKHSLKARVLHNNTHQSNNQDIRSTVVFADYNFRRKYELLRGLEFIGGLTSNYAFSRADMYGASGTDINKMYNFSGYAQIEKNFFKTLNLSLGARLEYFSMTGAENVLVPIFRAGASLKVGKETYTRVSYGQGYRYPTIAERYIRTVVGTFGVFENPDLQPEKSWNAEVGVKQGFKFLNYFGYLDIAIFQQEYRNTVEYLFSFWDSTYQTVAGAGFKFVNTGKSRITGIDISVTGMANLGGNSSLKTILGYTYISPKTLDPDYVYAVNIRDDSLTYENTSLDPSNNILKYRFLHTFKGDIEVDIFDVSFGVSAKYFSRIENLDKSIQDFEEATKNTGGTTQEIRYMDYFNEKNNGNLILDARVSYSLNDHHKISLISNNLLNRAYSLRPLKAEPMRTIMLQYMLKI
jgi:iron complex outermembrane receptor protein